ncbi:ribosomal RNA processing protein 1 homolog A-like isoform X4 [Narcine bancroftii]|uniref:ribosomal RNA processing protein 1 homolog A-like isoform X4 n=1 Tax=Narcine bancroftii TaxID=1343680 RepID=UPI003831A037
MAAPAAEIQFAQCLASNEKRLRNRAVRKLRRYLSARSQLLSGGFSQEELLKIWKGIFYCMWMQDKPLLQEELADSIAQLVHSFRNLDAKFLFLETFFQTMNREWNGIDRLRMDKFYTLIRLVLRQFLEELKSMDWDESTVNRFLSCVTDEVLSPARNSAPNGIRYHFIDIYLQELAKVGTQQLTAEQNLKFIDPFCRIAAKTKDRMLFHMISQGIFELIVDQAPFAIEDLMNELQASEGDDESGKELTSREESEDLEKPKINGSALGEGAELPKSDGDEENANQPGYDHDAGPVLQFDYGAVADRLFQLSSRGSTPTQNRKRLYKLVRKFRDLAEGIFPQDMVPSDMSSDDEDEDDLSWRKKKKKNQRQEKALEGKEAGVGKKKAGKRKDKKMRCSKGRLPSGASKSEEPTSGVVKELSAPPDPELWRKKKKKLRPVNAAVILETAAFSSDMPRVESPRQEIQVTTQGDTQPSILIQAQNAAEPREFVKFSKVPTPKPIFFKKAGGTPRRCMKMKTMSSSSEKKVRFGLRKNTTAEFKRTDKSLLVSPSGTSRVAFDPKQQPHHSVLKSNLTPTCSPALRPKLVLLPATKRPTAMDFF